MEQISIVILLPWNKILTRACYDYPIGNTGNYSKKNSKLSPVIKICTSTSYLERERQIRDYINGIYPGLFCDSEQNYVIKRVMEDKYVGLHPLFLLRFFGKIHFSTKNYNRADIFVVNLNELKDKIPEDPKKIVEHQGYNVGEIGELSNLISELYA